MIRKDPNDARLKLIDSVVHAPEGAPFDPTRKFLEGSIPPLRPYVLVSQSVTWDAILQSGFMPDGTLVFIGVTKEKTAELVTWTLDDGFTIVHEASRIGCLGFPEAGGYSFAAYQENGSHSILWMGHSLEEVCIAIPNVRTVERIECWVVGGEIRIAAQIQEWTNGLNSGPSIVREYSDVEFLRDYGENTEIIGEFGGKLAVQETGVASPAGMGSKRVVFGDWESPTYHEADPRSFVMIEQKLQFCSKRFTGVTKESCEFSIHLDDKVWWSGKGGRDSLFPLPDARVFRSVSDGEHEHWLEGLTSDERLKLESGNVSEVIYFENVLVIVHEKGGLKDYGIIPRGHSEEDVGHSLDKGEVYEPEFELDVLMRFGESFIFHVEGSPNFHAMVHAPDHWSGHETSERDFPKYVPFDRLRAVDDGIMAVCFDSQTLSVIFYPFK